MATPPSRFVIVPHQPRSRWRPLLLGLGWLASLGLAALLTQRMAVPQLAKVSERLQRAESELVELRASLDQAEQDVVSFKRSDQVSRDAMTQLQAMLAEREEEISALRADVVFYERLVGGSEQRKGLAIHDAQFRLREDGDAGFSITLTQNLKKSGFTRGSLRFSIEGSQGGNLSTLDWSALRQQEAAPPVDFEFRYFQKVEGSVMLPAGFVPRRVLITVQRDGASIERAIPWEDTQKSEGNSDVRQ